MVSSSSSSSLLAPPGAAVAETGSEKSAVSSLLQSAAKRVKSSPRSEASGRSVVQPAPATNNEEDANDSDPVPDVDWKLSQRGLVTKAEVVQDNIRYTAEIFPLDVDQRFYWAMTLRTSVANRWDAMFRRGLLRRWNLDTGATGLGAEIWMCAAAGIPLASDCCGCEPHQAVREVLLHNQRHVFGHFFENFECMIKRCGMCYRCGTFCDASAGLICLTLRAVFPDKRRDVVVIGPPCQPFSFLSSTNKQQGASSHKLFPVLFPPEGKAPAYGGCSVLDFLAVHLPLVAVIEEAVAFADVDTVDGVCWLRAFVEKAKALVCPFTGLLYYVAVDVYTEEPGRWLNMRRPRFPNNITHYVIPQTALALEGFLLTL